MVLDDGHAAPARAGDLGPVRHARARPHRRPPGHRRHAQPVLHLADLAGGGAVRAVLRRSRPRTRSAPLGIWIAILLGHITRAVLSIAPLPPGQVAIDPRSASPPRWRPLAASSSRRSSRVSKRPPSTIRRCSTSRSPPPPPPPPTGGRPPSGGGPPAATDAVPLHDAARSRYLNYALSVITARALPDVRDGLKPVQRRILFSMWQQGLTRRRQTPQVGDGRRQRARQLPPARRRLRLRRARAHGAVVLAALSAGRRLGQLRLARRRSTRPPTATPSAAWRVSPISSSIELDQDTVAMRPNFDGTKAEPVVLPARIPNLLVNGATGIAVGMATNIPPHNLGEVMHGAGQAARQRRADDRAVVPLDQGARLPHRRRDPEHARTS